MRQRVIKSSIFAGILGVLAVAGIACGVAQDEFETLDTRVTTLETNVKELEEGVESLEAIAEGLLPDGDGDGDGDGDTTTPPTTPSDNEYIHGTFDLSTSINENIRDGVTEFGINQQQPLQGYFSILTLALLDRVGVTPPSAITNTGPALVTADNLDTSPTRFAYRQGDDAGESTLSVEEIKARVVQEDYTFYAIQHGRCDNDAFWCFVEAGQNAAAADLGINLEIVGSEPGAFQEEAELLDTALAANPDGISVTFGNDALRNGIQRGLDAGIPIVVHNAGAGPEADNLDYLTYIGQDEYAGGFQGGRRLVEAAGSGTHTGVCFNQNPAQTSLQQRCQGFADYLTDNGHSIAGAETGVQISNTAAEAQQTISDFIASNPNVDIVLTLGPNGAAPYYAWADANESDAEGVEHGTFDTGEQIFENIRDGRTLFGINQQPFLQGYLGITWLYLHHIYDVIPPDQVTQTGPGFITADNIDSIPESADDFTSRWENDVEIEVVHHGEAGNVWWATMNTTIELVESNIGADVNIRVPTEFNLQQVRDLITQAVATSPDGLAVTVTDPVLFKPPIDSALDAGIHVVGFNASKGGPDEDNIEYATFIGQDERTGGERGGMALAEVAPANSRAVCINQEVGHIGLDARCAGFVEAMEEAGIPVAGNNGVLGITNDIAASVQTLSDFFAANPDVNIVFTLGPSSADAFYGFLDQS